MSQPPLCNLANALTLIRFPLAPLAVWLLMLYPPANTAAQPGWIAWALATILALTFLSDYFDGIAARRLNMVTNFGKVMDPVADSAFFLSFVFGLCVADRFGEAFPIWFALIVLYREIAMHVLRRYAALKGVVMAAKKSGKAKTALQSILLSVFVLLLLGHDNQYVTIAENTIQTFVFWTGALIAGANIVSMIEYVQDVPRLMQTKTSSSNAD